MIADIIKSGLIVGAFIALSWLIFQAVKMKKAIVILSGIILSGLVFVSGILFTLYHQTPQIKNEHEVNIKFLGLKNNYYCE